MPYSVAEYTLNNKHNDQKNPPLIWVNQYLDSWCATHLSHDPLQQGTVVYSSSKAMYGGVSLSGFLIRDHLWT